MREFKVYVGFAPFKDHTQEARSAILFFQPPHAERTMFLLVSIVSIVPITVAHVHQVLFITGRNASAHNMQWLRPALVFLLFVEMVSSIQMKPVMMETKSTMMDALLYAWHRLAISVAWVNLVIKLYVEMGSSVEGNYVMTGTISTMMVAHLLAFWSPKVPVWEHLLFASIYHQATLR